MDVRAGRRSWGASGVRLAAHEAAVYVDVDGREGLDELCGMSCAYFLRSLTLVGAAATSSDRRKVRAATQRS